jgi:hypothetical protein
VTCCKLSAAVLLVLPVLLLLLQLSSRLTVQQTYPTEL